jgi:hypothetical protein
MTISARAIAAVWLVCGAAFGQSQAAVTTAREVAKQGLQAYDAGRYDEAAQKLSQAYAVVQVPTLALYTARSLVKLAKLVEASELYLQATRLSATGSDASAQEQAQRDAAAERAELLPRIPRVAIRIEGAKPDQVSVSINGTAVPPALLSTGQLVNPGACQVTGVLGEQSVEQSLQITEGAQETVVLRFTAAPAPAAANPAATAPAAAERTIVSGPTEPAASPEADRAAGLSTQRALGWTSLGLGAAGFAVGTVVGLVALDKKRALEDGGCEENHCFVDQDSEVKSYNSMRLVSTVGYGVAGVGLAAGLILLVTAPGKSEPDSATAHLSPWIGLGSAGVGGRF